jgi:tetratricopeptide (TPR) repeat protein
MGGHISNQNSFPSSSTASTTIASSTTTHTRQRVVENFLLIWVDANIDQLKKDCQNTSAQLRNIVNDVNICTEPEQCIQFLNDIQNEKAFIIVSGSLGQHLVPNIHAMSQVDTIYVYCGIKSRHEEWAKNWIKIKGVHTEIKSICEALQLAAKQCNEDSTAVSFMPVGEGMSNQNLNQLDASFMYTQIFKEILLDMKHDPQAIQDLANYCRNLYKKNTGELNIINEFVQAYRPVSSIWWYTRECFTYQMLNRALRTLEGDTIINMGFFIHDLHRKIKQLYNKQVKSYDGKPFIVYRGQGLSFTDFEKLQKTKGGLMFFNNFLSTSKRQEISLNFGKTASGKIDMIGIQFKMTIDPLVSSTPFAVIDEVSYFKTEEEILFSMHTVFRIGEITRIDKCYPLYQVELKLTADDDEQLRTLTHRIRKETAGATGWKRLDQLLIKLSQFDKAEELYKLLLEQTSDDGEKANYYHQLGCIKDGQGDYEKAIGYYGKSLKIRQKTLPPTHPVFANSYNNIGLVYDKMGEHSKALSFYEKSFEIRQKTLSPTHPDLATSHNNIGSVYYNMGEYSKALSFYEKALEIRQKTLPPNHPDLATSYNNIGLVYDKMGEYSKALLFHEKSLEIDQKTLPQNHPNLATSYNNIGLVYDKMGEYSKALVFHKKSLEIDQKTLPPNHPLLAISYNNIGSVYKNMGEYSKALSFYEKSFEIRQKTLPPNHPDLANSYNNIGLMYDKMRDYSKALLFHENSLEIRLRTLPPNHPDLATSYDNIGSVYNNMGEYSKALSYFERAPAIRQRSLPSTHPDLKSVQESIETVKKKL